ncbi:S-layer homology domain-containing protein [Arthrobacter cavernae]|uniref:S-layer homology domain-containing protein n=1 Tax=Arthrobacter cavernae TaxID=2817681 RepID=A0A939KJA7_9MICC|nr:S-layer homology domain-containing protein [Arthrobacter cavernae]MBO1268482.1 S-layer homology domain-containing protein [Arthrobacter cavernae]
MTGLAAGTLLATLVSGPAGAALPQAEGPGPGEGPNIEQEGQLEGPFIDVSAAHQFATEITWMKDRGITEGFTDGTFRPLSSVNRAAMAAFLFRFSGSPNVDLPATSPFTDVPTDHQFFEEIVWLKNTGITMGITPTTFGPQMAVNRKDMAAFIFRLEGEPEFTPPAVSPFSDMTPASQFYKEVTWLASNGITTGFPDGTFHPFEDVHRDATAAFLFRFDQAF